MANLPRWAEPYMDLGKYRYKVAFGGRGGAKTTTFARILVMLVAKHGLKVMCCRQFQSSIDESVKGALESAIYDLNLGQVFRVLDKSIVRIDGVGGFWFKGIERNVMSIKGWDNFDIVWVEEANTLRQDALELLRPTIRQRKGPTAPTSGELWFSFNRHKLSDAVDKFFLGAEQPSGLLIKKVNYYDNPYFGAALEQERADSERMEPERYNHIWLGEPDLDGDSMLIPQSLVMQAVRRDTSLSDLDQPLVMGVDPARLGGDRFCICFRRGRAVIDFQILPKSNLTDASSRLGQLIREHSPERVFIDVGGLGVGVYDILIQNKFPNVVAVNFGGKALDNRKYYNKRAEMYGTALDWFNDEFGVSLSGNKDLVYELVGELALITKDFTPSGTLKLQPKEKFKKDGFKSPDLADSFVLTFAQPVANHALINRGLMFGSGNVKFANDYEKPLI